MSDTERQLQPGVSEMLTLNLDGAIAIQEAGIELATQMGIGGFIAVYSRTGLQECSQAVGSGTPRNVDMTTLKIRTVLNFRRSTSEVERMLRENGYSREDYGEQIGTLLAGGVAIFADPGLQTFLGGAVFSGGKPDQDEEILRSAIEKSGLYTDLSPQQEISQ